MLNALRVNFENFGPTTNKIFRLVELLADLSTTKNIRCDTCQLIGTPIATANHTSEPLNSSSKTVRSTVKS